MNLRPAAIVLTLAGCWALAGCRSSDPNIPLLEAELRWMENQYYGLENQYNRKCQELESCRMANQALQSRGQSNASRSTQPRTSEPTPADRPPPSSRRPRNGEDTLPPLEPMVEGVPEIGAPMQGSGGRPSGTRTPVTPPADDDELLPRPLQLQEPLPPGNSRAPSELRSASLSTPSTTPAVLPSQGTICGPVGDPEVLRIVLNRQLTGGYDRDGVPGDDGVLVVIEPQNRAGEFVPVAGPISLTLTDPRAQDSDNLVAAWRLTEEQAAVKMRRSLLGRGLHLELPWPDDPPTADTLQLTVNYTTVDGRKLLAQREITIQAPRSVSARWTPVSPHAARLADRPESPAPAIEKTDASPAWQPYR